eukprot:NODE_158_length_15065_cov_0.349125.p14 type:complete len:111 gc:universal NODE_158_length_15065_cov_0.349125:14655-14987(+)
MGGLLELLERVLISATNSSVLRSFILSVFGIIDGSVNNLEVSASAQQSIAVYFFWFFLVGDAPNSNNLRTIGVIPWKLARCNVVFPFPHIIPKNANNTILEPNLILSFST